MMRMIAVIMIIIIIIMVFNRVIDSNKYSIALDGPTGSDKMKLNFKKIKKIYRL